MRMTRFDKTLLVLVPVIALVAVWLMLALAQRAEAAMPMPQTPIVVHDEPCPYYPYYVAGCTTLDGHVWIHPAAAHRREVYWHEVGHNVDHQTLLPWHRRRFIRLLDRPWEGEVFAEVYSRCILGRGPIRGWGIRRYEHRRTCAFLRTLA